MEAHYTPAQLKKAAALLDLMDGGSEGRKAVGFKHDLSGGGVAPYGHGWGGLFNTPGTDENVFSAMMLPNMGLLDRLPLMPSGSAAPSDQFGGVDSPFYTTITGVTQGAAEVWANMPAGVCDPAPEGGLMKVCTLTAPYGRFPQCLRAVEIGQVGHMATYADPTNLRIVNLPGQMRDGGAVTPAFAMPGTVLNVEVQRRMFEGFTSYKRAIAPYVWTGTPSANTANDGAMQFIGMETLVNTGNKVDALNGTPCAAMDSDVKNFDYELVSGTGRSIVDYMDTMYGYLKWNATRMGMNPVKWVVSMRPELFDEVVKVWPIEQHLYALERIAQYGGGGGRVVIDATTATRERMDMLNNLWLPIRGDRVEVVLDDSIPEDNVTTTGRLVAGQYASDIYFIPLTVLGGIPVTWWETFNFDNGNVRAVLQLFQNREAVWVSDGGRFLFYTRRTETCVNLCWRMEPRIIMRTPYLAGRILNVSYQPLQHFRQAFPADPYFVNGGRTNTAINRYYTEASPTTPVVMP